MHRCYSSLGVQWVGEGVEGAWEGERTADEGLEVRGKEEGRKGRWSEEGEGWKRCIEQGCGGKI